MSWSRDGESLSVDEILGRSRISAFVPSVDDSASLDMLKKLHDASHLPVERGALPAALQRNTLFLGTSKLSLVQFEWYIQLRLLLISGFR